jgi:Zn-dependent protease
MGQCWFCGAVTEELTQCPSCKKGYCNLHSDPTLHDCPGVPIMDIAPMPASNYVAPVDSTPVPLGTQQPAGYTPSEEDLEQSTQDGSYVWHGKQEIPEDAFSPDSGIEMKGIFWQKGKETYHLLIGGGLMFLFGYLTFSFLKNIFGDLAYYHLPTIETWHILLIAAIFTGSFLGHEFGHRQVAKHHKMQTKFRLFTMGLIITSISIVTAFFGAPGFGFPGAVVVIGLEEISRETGQCKIAGPLVNLVIGSILFCVAIFVLPGISGFPLNFVLYYAAYFNFQLGVFNMLPFGPLDGRNIIKWKPKLWILLMGALAAFMIYIIVSLNNASFVFGIFLGIEV